MSDQKRLGPPKPRGWIDSPTVRNGAGWLIAQYLRFVGLTNRMERDPPEPAQRRYGMEIIWPAIFVSWHANIFALPYFLDPELPGDVVPLVSPHFDGQLAAAIARTLGHRVVVGTGVSERQNEGTGGLQAMRTMLDELQRGNSVWLTAEVPPTPGRRVSPGVIALARASGRPIIVLAAASSRRRILERLWDKLQIHLPFGRMTLIFDGPLYVNGVISNDEARTRLKAMLDATYAEALRRADAPR